MSRKRVTYDANLRKTEHGAKLYNLWRKVCAADHDPIFDNFLPFYEWAMKTYTISARLLRKDEDKPYSPENCYFEMVGNTVRGCDITLSRAAEWNRFINSIRKNLSMPPLPGTTYDEK